MMRGTSERVQSRVRTSDVEPQCRQQSLLTTWYYDLDAPHVTSPPLLVLYPYIPPLATRILSPSALTPFGTCCTSPLSAVTWHSKSFVSPPLCQGHTDLPECAEFNYELDCPEEHADESLESPGMLTISVHVALTLNK